MPPNMSVSPPNCVKSWQSAKNSSKDKRYLSRVRIKKNSFWLIKKPIHCVWKETKNEKEKYENLIKFFGTKLYQKTIFECSKSSWNRNSLYKHWICVFEEHKRYLSRMRIQDNCEVIFATPVFIFFPRHKEEKWKRKQAKKSMKWKNCGGQLEQPAIL